MTPPRTQLLLPVRNRAAFLEAYFSRGPRQTASVAPAPSEPGEPGAPVTTSLLPGWEAVGSANVDPPDNRPGFAGAGTPAWPASEAMADDESGGMFVPGEIDVVLGEVVDVELFFHEEQVRFHIRAQVKWLRTRSGRRSLPAGVGIAFLPSEHRTQQQILRYAEGKQNVSHVDRSRRWSLHVEVQLGDDASNQVVVGVTDDISEGGCFVVTNARLEPGALVGVRLKVPGTLFGWVTLDGQVTWRREQADRSGVGIELKFANQRQRLKIKKIVDVVKERTLRQVRIKAPRLPSLPPTSV